MLISMLTAATSAGCPRDGRAQHVVHPSTPSAPAGADCPSHDIQGPHWSEPMTSSPRGAAGVPALGQPYMTVSHDGGATWSRPLVVAAPGVKDVTEDAFTVGAIGHVAITYLGTTDGQGFNGYITESWDANRVNPLFWSASVNNPKQPLMVGSVATSAVHGDRMWFITVEFGPGGTPWAAFHCAHTQACPLRDGVAARLVSQPGQRR